MQTAPFNHDFELYRRFTIDDAVAAEVARHFNARRTFYVHFPRTHTILEVLPTLHTALVGWSVWIAPADCTRINRYWDRTLTDDDIGRLLCAAAVNVTGGNFALSMTSPAVERLAPGGVL